MLLSAMAIAWGKEGAGWMEFYTTQNLTHSEEEIFGGRREARTKGERRQHPGWVGRPNGSAEPIWDLLGLPLACGF
jgi:hypothetical protein